MHLEQRLVLLYVRTILADVCINSVFLHSTTSRLPSTQLFCVISENAAKRIYDEPSAVGTLKELDKLIPLEQQQRFTSLNLNDVVNVERSDGVKTVFEYPTSVLSDKCTGTAFVPLGRNFSSECSLSLAAFNSSECTKISFLSAEYYIRLYFLMMFNNDTALINTSSSDVRRSQWSGNMCKDLVTEVRLTFSMNRKNITNATIEFAYSTVTRENFTNIRYRIEVVFDETQSTRHVHTNIKKTNLEGYDLGDRIITSNGYLKLPHRWNCNDSNAVEIRFGVDTTTGCEMTMSDCASLRSRIKQLFASFEYLNISSSPNNQSTQVKVFITTEPSTTRSSAISCDLTTSVTMEVGFARRGDQHNFKRCIISLVYRYGPAQVYALDDNSQSAVPIVFFVHFIDMSKPAVNIFVRFPTINLAIPSDFFYPFLISSAQQPFLKFCSLNIIPFILLLSFCVVHLNIV